MVTTDSSSEDRSFRQILDSEMDRRGFHLEHSIGSGGFAECFEVSPYADPFDKKVVKVYKGPRFSEYFSHEVEALRRLTEKKSVPNILLKGRLPENYRDYFVMDLARGKSLEGRDLIDGFRYEDKIKILRGVADAMLDVHEKGIVHADLKKGAVFYEERNVEIPVQLIDFSVSRFGMRIPTDSRGKDLLLITDLVGVRAGTPQIMAPEQCSHVEPLSEATDSHAFVYLMNSFFRKEGLYPKPNISRDLSASQRKKAFIAHHLHHKLSWNPDTFLEENPTPFGIEGEDLVPILVGGMKKSQYDRMRMPEIKERLDDIWERVK